MDRIAALRVFGDSEFSEEKEARQLGLPHGMRRLPPMSEFHGADEGTHGDFALTHP